MEEESKIVFLICASVIIASFSGTYILRKVAHKFNMLDIPVERSSHIIPTPRIGGIAIVITWYIGITILFLSDLIAKDLFFAFLAGAILFVISFLDDLFSLRPIFRLGAQFATVTLSIYFIGGLRIIMFGDLGLLSQIAFLAITIIGMVWFINLFNFLDGIDAYASIEAVFIASGIFILIQDPLLLILISAILGFLYWNWPKAKIFMGDMGSTQLGYILITLGLYYHNSGELNIIYWIILSSTFWFDATLTLFRRFINREKLSDAHKRHAYQRIVQAGFSHLKTNIYALVINSVILTVVLISYHFKVLIIPGIALILIMLYAITRIIDRKHPF